LGKILDEDFKYIYSMDLPWERLNNKTVLVTGGSGLIGSLLLKYMTFLNEHKSFNIKLITVSRNIENAQKILAGIPVKIIESDISKELETDDGIDYIFHCAAITKSKEMIEHPISVYESIVVATQKVLELAALKNVESMVYLSSMEVYGQPDKEHEYVTEKDMGYIDCLQVRSCYPLGKRMAENLCVDYGIEHNVPVKIARLAQVFGAGILSGESRVFAQFARSACNGENIVLHTDGTSVGNYCYTADAIYGLFTLLFNGKNREAYNIANEDNNMMIRDMAQLVATRVANDKIKVVFDIPDGNKYGYAQKVKMKLCTDKIKQIGWNAKYDMYNMYVRMIKERSL